MLLSRALSKLLDIWSLGEDSLSHLSPELMLSEVTNLLMGALDQLLLTHNCDGSWGSIGPYEETAYAVLALTSLRQLPLSSSNRQYLDLALSHGRYFLLPRRDESPEFLWIEKISYGSPLLRDAYVLAARHGSVSTANTPAKISDARL